MPAAATSAPTGSTAIRSCSDAYRKAQAELPAKLQRLRDLVTEDGSDPDRLERVSALIAQDTAALAASLTPIEPGPLARVPAT